MSANDTKNIKQIVLPQINESKNKKVELEHPEKIIKKRIITQTDKWITQLSNSEQYECVQRLQKTKQQEDKASKLILQQIQQKISGYRGQDIEKDILDEAQLINTQQVLDLMVKTENICYYCKKQVAVLYENVREPTQWTLDRIDNKHGHNHNNVLLACLNCNLRRRTMHTERYVFTKQLNIVKHD
jgi:hypothetical protein